ncbi:BZIP-type transcription factor [Emericellopsis atlantica]|uniref:BZIP-type transcription factor n=1 Tax=Emericellopsis atlantica TaxID=2614577 RepID=A0A9P7ZRQ4_9HYPO|nr:BZIP-type transcription factor [Emericellopsis atlantica]KAG9257089.1 BZIP-type transcription factor [Emericellopsis atlantica]
MADDPQRHSLAAMLRKGKQRLFSTTSTSSDSQAPAPSSHQSSSTTQTPPDGGDTQQVTKQQARRAQVRSAQLRHRQRKADHQKELELDVSRYRGLIASARDDAEALRKENEAMMTALRELGVCSTQQDGNGNAAPELFSGVHVDDVAVCLKYDESLDSACFTISSTPPSLVTASTAATSTVSNESMTRQQEDAAINFVLALEHVCWDHYTMGDFAHHAQPTLTGDEDDKNQGHHLMATALCMEDAPEEVYGSRTAFSSNHHHPSIPFLSRRPVAPSPPPELRWEASGITLSNLRGLAASLNPGPEEVTPVQAWFELAERYSPVTLVESGMLQALQLQLKGVVRCVSFGAAMERAAFESVVERVLQQHQIQ